MNPKFVVVEGVDYSGKSTFVDKLKRALQAKGYKVATFAAPSKYGNEGVLRQYIIGNPDLSDYSLMCLMAASMAQTQAQIQECLDNGFIVICDRWYYSMWAYQVEPNGHLWELYFKLTEQLLQPDLLITLDVVYDQYKVRMGNRKDQNHLDTQDQAVFHQRRNSYLNYLWQGKYVNKVLASKVAPISSGFKSEEMFFQYCLDYFA